MSGDVLLGAVDDIPVGEGRTFEVGGRPLAVFHTNAGEIYATQAFCPHRSGPLADGLLGDGIVVCPLHERVYDLKTGCGLSHDHPKIAAFPVRVADGRIWITQDALGTPDTPIGSIAQRADGTALWHDPDKLTD